MSVSVAPPLRLKPMKIILNKSNFFEWSDMVQDNIRKAGINFDEVLKASPRKFTYARAVKDGSQVDQLLLKYIISSMDAVYCSKYSDSDKYSSLGLVWDSLTARMKS